MSACRCLLNLDFWSFLSFLQMFLSPAAAVAGIQPGQGEAIAQELSFITFLFSASIVGSFCLSQWPLGPQQGDFLPKKELTQSGYSLKPQRSMNLFSDPELDRKWSLDFADFPLKDKLGVGFPLFHPKLGMCTPKIYHTSLTPQ